MCKECDHKIIFGRHEGMTLKEVWDDDPHYVRWMAKEYKGGDTRIKAITFLSKHDYKPLPYGLLPD